MSDTRPTRRLETRCCIVGGGPAGMVLGLLLARAGVEIVVLEKHTDFLRDFRGDTIHASTLELMHELGLLDRFLKLPHQESHQFAAYFGAASPAVIDFAHLPTRCKYIALMPQWDFLDFLAAQGRRYPGYELLTRTEAVDLIEADGRVVGVRAETANGALEVRADLVVAADGRHSTVRQCAGFEVVDLGAPMDVLWTRLPRRPTDGSDPNFRAASGRILVLIDRGDYWQCAFLIPKGGYDEFRRQGLPAFRESMAAIAPFMADRVDLLTDWDDIKLLTVRVDRLRQWWRPGLLCIGDAAHAMSPIGGVGINLAIQDAVAAANILAAPLSAQVVTDDHLRQVQRRRMFPTRVTQRIQLAMQNSIIKEVLAGRGEVTTPLPFRMLRSVPWLRRIAGRLIAVGIRPEHIGTPDTMADDLLSSQPYAQQS
ncbi:MAG: FAD-dependent oxidoreductase [Alphaproteobacteria bacterium]|nr:FAD-dependent oxidoreductase [Alphaproteobacteria bacterium]